MSERFAIHINFLKKISFNFFELQDDERMNDFIYFCSLTNREPLISCSLDVLEKKIDLSDEDLLEGI
jgi:hypothetical protein